MQNISSIETDNTSTEIVDNMCAPAKALKRICDFIGAALAMILSSPLYLYIALRHTVEIALDWVRSTRR